MQLFLILALLIAVALVLFAAQNATVITLSFLGFNFEGSLAFILVIVFASGLISGILMSMPSLMRKGSALKEQKRKVKQLEEGMKTTPSHQQGNNQPPL
ncbi:MAG: DUF1049 domain-containing protein [Thermodesulfovibrio sp.]|nr:DUF1049 domain-containing protein [Thermodesulfovibrio sp.]